MLRVCLPSIHRISHCPAASMLVEKAAFIIGYTLNALYYCCKYVYASQNKLRALQNYCKSGWSARLVMEASLWLHSALLKIAMVKFINSQPVHTMHFKHFIRSWLQKFIEVGQEMNFVILPPPPNLIVSTTLRALGISARILLLSGTYNYLIWIVAIKKAR